MKKHLSYRECDPDTNRLYNDGIQCDFYRDPDDINVTFIRVTPFKSVHHGYFSLESARDKVTRMEKPLHGEETWKLIFGDPEKFFED